MKKAFQLSISILILLSLAIEVKSQHPYLPQTGLANMIPAEYFHPPTTPVSNHLDNLVFLLDSTYSYKWNEELNDWDKHLKYIYKYNAAGRSMEENGFVWLNAWENNLWTTRSYYPSGQAADIVNYKPSQNTGEWVANSKLSLFYDNAGTDPSEMIAYEWVETTSTWLEKSRSTYLFNDQGDIVEYNEFLWNSETNTWLEQFRILFQFDNQGRQTERINYLWNNEMSIWEPISRVLNNYNGFEEIIIFKWNLYTDSWESDILLIREDNMDSTETTTSVYKFDTTVQYWALQFRGREVRQVISPVMATRTDYVWNIPEMTWELNLKIDYEYDFNGNQVEQILSDWAGGAWKFRDKVHDYWSQHDLVLDLQENSGVDFVIYPNPVKNAIFVRGMDGPISVKIFSENGSLVQSGKLNDGSELINVQYLPGGKYFIQLTSNGKTLVKPFVKP